MDYFYIITNVLKDEDFRITKQIQKFIEENGKHCVLAKKDEEGHIIPGSVPKGIDCAIVLGGDGTLIRAARELTGYDIPMLGINMGTLGYLTQAELPNLEETLLHLFSGKVDVEERMMMCGTTPDGKENIALNDIVVTREGNLRIVHFNVYVNGVLLNSYMADGVIISTPTGTTGYNLSAGGPIVEPTAQMFVITPICSHALNTSSVVLTAEDTIEVEIGEGRYGRNEGALVAYDGAETIPVMTGNRILIRRAEEKAKLVKLSKESFMKIMREKMKGN